MGGVKRVQATDLVSSGVFALWSPSRHSGTLQGAGSTIHTLPAIIEPSFGIAAGRIEQNLRSLKLFFKKCRMDS